MCGIGLVVAACSSSYLEIHVLANVPVYSEPQRPSARGNTVVGTLPEGAIIRVKDEVYQKDFVAYRISYRDSSGAVIQGFVLLTANIDVVKITT